MPYVPRELRTESFIAGFSDVYMTVQANPEMRMIPISQLETVRGGLRQLGYKFSVRYRGPRRGQNRQTLKQDARAFNVYFKD
jgi:hypothetical protein